MYVCMYEYMYVYAYAYVYVYVYVHIYRAKASYPVVMDFAIKLGSSYGQDQKIAAINSSGRIDYTYM